jgi:urea carboxylase
VIYERPVFKAGGDRYLLIELGDELNLALNFTANGLADAIAQSGMKAIAETAPCFASLLVH